jgi:hypothetical protein
VGLILMSRLLTISRCHTSSHLLLSLNCIHQAQIMAARTSRFGKNASILLGFLFTAIVLISLELYCSYSSNICTLFPDHLDRVLGCSSPAQPGVEDFEGFEDFESDVTEPFALHAPKPLPWDSTIGITRRDICTDALPGSVSSMCTPSNTSTTTLCCKRIFALRSTFYSS